MYRDGQTEKSLCSSGTTVPRVTVPHHRPNRLYLHPGIGDLQSEETIKMSRRLTDQPCHISSDAVSAPPLVSPGMPGSPHRVAESSFPTPHPDLHKHTCPPLSPMHTRDVRSGEPRGSEPRRFDTRPLLHLLSGMATWFHTGLGKIRSEEEKMNTVRRSSPREKWGF